MKPTLKKELKLICKQIAIKFHLLYPYRIIIYQYRIIKFVLEIQKSKYLVCDQRKLVYVGIPKIASTSIKGSFMKQQEMDEMLRRLESKKEQEHEIQKRVAFKRQLSTVAQNYFKFGFVRNPFDRLYSCYKNKVYNSKANLVYPFGYFHHIVNFEHFVKKITKVPDAIGNPHFISQYYLLHKNNKCLIDSVGKFENLVQDFEPIRQKYQLEPLTHHNQSQARTDEWKNHYTEELAALIYKRYKKDFELFYPNAYAELLAYIKQSKPNKGLN